LAFRVNPLTAIKGNNSDLTYEDKAVQRKFWSGNSAFAINPRVIGNQLRNVINYKFKILKTTNMIELRLGTSM